MEIKKKWGTEGIALMASFLREYAAEIGSHNGISPQRLVALGSHIEVIATEMDEIQEEINKLPG